MVVMVVVEYLRNWIGAEAIVWIFFLGNLDFEVYRVENGLKDGKKEEASGWQYGKFGWRMK